MKTEDLQKRLDEINDLINQNIEKHNQLLKQKELEANELVAKHNMLIGQRNEVSDWLAKMAPVEA